MADEMTRRERLLAVVEGRPTDRVPVLSGHFGEWAEDWKSREPSYGRLVAFCREKCDGILSFSARPVNETAPGSSWRGARVEREERALPDGGRETVDTVHVPRGRLRRRFRSAPGAATQWQVEHLLKTAEDVEALLDVPYEPVRYDASGYEEAERRIGDAGLVLGEMPDALCLAADMFDFGTFTLMAMTEEGLFTRLVERFQRCVLDRVDALLSGGAIRLVRIYGPEYATPPFLPPHLFDRYVVGYDRELIGRIRRAGAHARIHCHGRVREALEKFIAMGASATDPVEPPPMGDVRLSEAKGIVDGRLTIFGNLEFRDLETLSREAVVELTRRTVEEGMPGGRFALQPTAEPITIPLNARLEENWMAYVETALKEGRYR